MLISSQTLTIAPFKLLYSSQNQYSLFRVHTLKCRLFLFVICLYRVSPVNLWPTSLTISWSNFRHCNLWLQNCYQPSYRNEESRQRKSTAAIQKAKICFSTMSHHYTFLLSAFVSLPSVFQATGIVYVNILAKEFVIATAVLTGSCALGIHPRDECCKSERAQNLGNCQLALLCTYILDSSEVHAFHPGSLFLWSSRVTT